MTDKKEQEKTRNKLRQELRDLIIRDFGMKHSLSSSEVASLIHELLELKPAEMSQKEREENRHKMREAGDKLLRSIEEIVDNCVLLCDVHEFTDLAQAIHMFTSYRLIKVIGDKGFDKELTKLCDKVGRAK